VSRDRAPACDAENSNEPEPRWRSATPKKGPSRAVNREAVVSRGRASINQQPVRAVSNRVVSRTPVRVVNNPVRNPVRETNGNHSATGTSRPSRVRHLHIHSGAQGMVGIVNAAQREGGDQK
jgi:hypothetical protein